jgi:putative ABC transport system permease protein
VQRALAADGGRSGTGGPSRGRARSVLVVAEVALAVSITVAAGLMIRSVWRLQHVDPGFTATGVLKAEFQLPASRYPVDFRRWPNFVEIHRFNAALLTQMARVPGVEAAALAANHPLDAGFTNSFVIVGREAESRNWPEISVRSVTPGYFRVLRVPLVRGRHLTQGDATTSLPVAVINEAGVRRFFGTRDPIGQQIAYWGIARTIVGIVGDERFHGLTEAPPPAVYAPLAQSPSTGVAVLVRGARPELLTGAVRAAIASHDPALAVFGIEPLDVTLAESIGQRRFVMLLLTVFAVVALLLAAAGIHAVLSYDVAQRTREIGIRLALGALPSGVTRLVVRRGALLALGGLLAGGVASLGLSRLLRSMLFDLAPGDAVTLTAVSLILGGVALAASYLPARRAVRTDPLTALREE